jgi:phosphoenolpyruvate synthase/pyruvate phosphate dikinase
VTDIVPLPACGPGQTERVGGKAAGLGSLLRENLQVPRGFALDADCYREFVAQAGLATRIQELLAGADSLETQADASHEIRRLFEERELAPGLQLNVASAYRGLGDEVTVAVRSSAIHEDSAHASFAGGHESYLGLTGEAAVCRAVLRCWGSLYTPHALAYFGEMNVRAADAAMGVVVQLMVPAESAGVMLTVDPVTGDRSQIAIEGSFGLGSAVASGEVSPDRFAVDKVTLEIRSRVISRKHLAYRFDAALGEIAAAAVTAERQQLPCLTDVEVVEIASLGRRVEHALGSPQDIEWAIGPGRSRTRDLFLLQTRPAHALTSKEHRRIASSYADGHPRS